MQTTIPLYGFGGGGGGTGTGAALTVNAPAGCTVTVSKDGKSKTKVAGADGMAVLKGLSTGQWTVTITDGSQTAQKTVAVTADYATAITFFSATIHVTYPAGFICTATNGATTLTAPDTSGTWDCVVPNAGMWTVSLDSGVQESVSVVTDGASYTVDRWHLYNSGNQCVQTTGGWWQNTEYIVVSNRTNTATVRFDENSIYCAGQSGKSAFASTKNKMNLRGFTTVKVVATVNQLFNLALTTKSSGSIDDVAYLNVGETAENKEYSIDIGTFQEAYIAVGTHNSPERNITVHEIWLE